MIASRLRWISFWASALLGSSDSARSTAVTARSKSDSRFHAAARVVGRAADVHPDIAASILYTIAPANRKPDGSYKFGDYPEDFAKFLPIMQKAKLI